MMQSVKTVAALLLIAASLSSPLSAHESAMRHHHPHHRGHPSGAALATPDKRSVGAPTGPAYQSDTSGTNNDGYVYNSLGYGRYVPGPDGSFGGYPLGSAGAHELMTQQREKCQAVPEEC